MKKFLLLYKGPATPPDASHEGWPEWFNKLGDKLVERGLPMAHGRFLRGDGSTGDSATRLNGYSIIQADDRGQDTTVNVYDYRSIADGKAVPYGIYDVVHNSGFVNVGIDHETAEFAVESIRRWWRSIGSGLYPRSQGTPDCG